MEYVFQTAGSDFHNHALDLLMSDQRHIISFTGVKEQSTSQLFPPNIVKDFQTARGGISSARNERCRANNSVLTERAGDFLLFPL